MKTYVLRRLLLMVPTFLLITAITFSLMQLAPGGPLEAKLRSGSGENSAMSMVTQEAKEAIAKLYGFDRPIWEQYVRWLGRILTLDFGESLFEYRSVAVIIFERLGIALLFGIPATLTIYSVSMLVGTLKALTQNSWFDRASSVVAFVFYSVPSVVTAIVLIVLFSVKLDWFPVVGLHSDDYEDLNMWAYLIDLGRHFVLPFTCYVIGGFAFLVELQKKSMLEELRRDYVRTARAKGLPERMVHFKHALRNALIPMITSLQSILVLLLGGSFIVEKIFTIPGLGYLGFTSLLNRDYPILMANLTLTALLGMLSMLLADVLYTLVDPRIKLR